MVEKTQKISLTILNKSCIIKVTSSIGVGNLIKKKRMIFGVVAAEANSIEQRQVIKGIARFNQCVGIDTIIFSNNYNPNIKEKELFCENRIYDLILSDELDGLIIISESFVNEDLRKVIADLLSRKTIPIVVVGTYLAELDMPQCTFINTSDENVYYTVSVSESYFADYKVFIYYTDRNYFQHWF